LFQRNEEGKPGDPGSSDTNDRISDLKQASEDMEKDFKAYVAEDNSMKIAEAQIRAKIFKQAFVGGYSKKGGWAWLKYPTDSLQYGDCRSLWLTRMPGKTFARQGADVMSQVTLSQAGWYRYPGPVAARCRQLGGDRSCLGAILSRPAGGGV